MNRTVDPGARSGRVRIPSSKSQAHRLLICAALGHSPCDVFCDGLSRDIEATVACLRALGADIRLGQGGALSVCPIPRAERDAVTRPLPCGESGSTLRFLLPVVGALGMDVSFLREGRLPERPLEPLLSQLCAHGMTFREEGAVLRAQGQLLPGAYCLPGNVSSQYISGLLMALPLLPGESTLTVTGPLESAAYVTLTEQALAQSGVRLEKHENSYRIAGPQPFLLPPSTQVEGDYSSAAFFLCMGALSDEGVRADNLNPDSAQGDRAILRILSGFGAQVRQEGSSVLVKRGALTGQVIDAAPVPDLIPVVSVLAAVAQGETRIDNAARLRLKESDRLFSTARMLRALGARVEELPDGLIIQGVSALHGGAIDSENDHRIAMSAAVAACASDGPVEVRGAQCVQKSYPRFWEDLSSLKGEPV